MECNLVINPNAKTVQDYFIKVKENDVLEVSMIEDIALNRGLPLYEAKNRFVMTTSLRETTIIGCRLASRYVNEKDEHYRV